MNANLPEERLSAVRARFAQWKVDGLLISSDYNRRWLSGFTGSNGYLLVTRSGAWLATDFRYWEQAAAQSPAFQLFKLTGQESESFTGLIAAGGVQRLGVEAAHVSIVKYSGWKKIEGMTWVPLKETVEPLRQVKAPAELEFMRRAAAITDQAMSQVNALARPGMTERQVAWALEKQLRQGGADDKAFEVIVASGPNSARPHHRPGDRLLQAGDAIIVDMGAIVDGYRSDLTRSFYLGPEADDTYGRVFHLVWEAQKHALGHMRAGMTGKAIDALARDVIVAAGHGEHFGHSLGHGVGLEMHEEPRLSSLREKETIPAGSVVTVEPGVYIPGWGGVRIEDLVVTTEDGVEVLSHCPKRPVIWASAPEKQADSPLD